MTATDRILRTLAGVLVAAMLAIIGHYLASSGGWSAPENASTGRQWYAIATSVPTHQNVERSLAGTAVFPLLGELTPASGLMPAGTVTITLRLTTTAPADCRWSSVRDTPHAEMPNPFQHGQGEVSHATPIAGIRDLDDLRFFVRCADTAGLIDPDSQEVQTHLRVLGPWDGAYPRIANLWPNYEPTLGADFYAGYDLVMPYWWPHDAPAASSLRAANPYEKILRTQNATYGWPELDELTGQWWDAEPGDWGYPCLFRDSGGEILLVRRWEHPMYNLIWPECRATLVQRNLEEFLSPDAEAGDDLAYDGIFWDLLKDSISWLGEDIDSDLDGRPDDAAQLDAAYQLAVEDFLEQIRDRLPDAILMGNETSTAYAPWVNGRHVRMATVDAAGWR